MLRRITDSKICTLEQKFIMYKFDDAAIVVEQMGRADRRASIVFPQQAVASATLITAHSLSFLSRRFSL